MTRQFVTARTATACAVGTLAVGLVFVACGGEAPTAPGSLSAGAAASAAAGSVALGVAATAAPAAATTTCPCEIQYAKAIVYMTLRGPAEDPVLQTDTVGSESVATCNWGTFAGQPDMTLSSKTTGRCSAIVRSLSDPPFDFALPASKAQREACAALLQSSCHR
jgi:hypothetical protein